MPRPFPIAFFALTIPTLVLVGCRGSKTAPPAPPPPVVAVLKPALQKVQIYYEYNGYLDAVEMVQVQARVEGVITDVLFREGDEVPKGRQLYAIDNREYLTGVNRSQSEITLAEADIENATIQIKIAQGEYDRLKALGRDIGKAELEKAESTLQANRT